jgi:hypothetical protein
MVISLLGGDRFPFAIYDAGGDLLQPWASLKNKNAGKNLPAYPVLQDGSAAVNF